MDEGTPNPTYNMLDQTDVSSTTGIITSYEAPTTEI